MSMTSMIMIGMSVMKKAYTKAYMRLLGFRHFVFVLLGVSALQGFDADTAKIMQAYRTGDEQKLSHILDSYLEKKDFWLSVLQGRNTDFGYFETYKFLFVSDKSLPNLALYTIEPSGALVLVKELPALVGKGKGDKRIEGDLATPLGVYDFTDKFTKLPQYYGPLAYATDYPNSYDKSLKKTGYGIWIHGLPLDGNREELNTKGCIAIDNDVLSDFGKMVDYRQALLISYEQNIHKPTKDELASLLAQLYMWRAAWAANDLDTYLSFYSADFSRPDGMRYNAFAAYKKQVFAKNEEKIIRFSDISVVPYPNEEHRQMFRISYMQDYRAYKRGKPSYTSSAQKILYIIYDNGAMRIVSEK